MDKLIVLPGDKGGWRVGDVEFVQGFTQASTPRRFHIQKNQSIIDLYVRLYPAFRRGRIVELGIAAGGSTALLALLTTPSKLVACDVATTPVSALADFIDANGLGETVRPFYGVDQGDAEVLGDIIDTEFGTERLDLVIDDASHVWDKTCASFEALYPRLRTDGLFVIEDWAGQYFLADEIAHALEAPGSHRYVELKAQYDEAIRTAAKPRPPLAQLGLQLLLAAAASPAVVTEVSVNQHWITVRRGPAPLDPGTFRLSDLYTDHFEWLAQDPHSADHWWLTRLWEGAASTVSTCASATGVAKNG